MGEEALEAARFYGIQPSLDTIKESPSTASMLGVLQGGVSSASVNTVLQGSASSAEVHKEIKDETLQKDQIERKAATERISEEKDHHEEKSTAEELKINNSQGTSITELQKTSSTKLDEEKSTDKNIKSLEEKV